METKPAQYALQDKVPLQNLIPPAANVHERFRRIHQVGHGTYGEVYLAEDLFDARRRRVALKKIKVDASKEKRQGFPITAIREIRVLQRLRHENIVPLLDVCRSNSVHPFLQLAPRVGSPAQ
jgi:serine/threonine protein kinase